jgi:hypothetical protein
MWLRFRFCWARRRAGKDLPAPPLPSTDLASPVAGTISGDTTRVSMESSTSTSPRPFRRRYPEFEMFYSQEEASEARRQRRSTIGAWPTSAVERARRKSLIA